MVPMIVEVKGVRKTYDNGVEALRDVDLSFPKGQLSTLLGPSGCGKTTLLKIIAGLIPKNGGEVLVNGKAVRPGTRAGVRLSGFRAAAVGRRAEERGLRPGATRSERKKRDEVAREVHRRGGLEGFRAPLPAQLSGGMRQRVGLARALTVDADIILMDEPFSSVDEQTRRKFQEDLLDLLRHHQKTVIFVTHSIEEAAYLDQIALLSPRRARVEDCAPGSRSLEESGRDPPRPRLPRHRRRDLGILRQYV